MDMLPMNKTYYTENIIEYDHNKFIYYRDRVASNSNVLMQPQKYGKIKIIL